MRGRYPPPIRTPSLPLSTVAGRGDLARCLGDHFWRQGARVKPGPAPGEVYQVADQIYINGSGFWLRFAEFSEETYPAGFFRKVVTRDPEIVLALYAGRGPAEGQEA